MKSHAIVRVLVFLAVAAGIATFVTLSQRERPRLISVKPVDKRTRMPQFSWLSTAGTPWSLEQHKGKIVLVNFWATWCGPCRQETPDLVDVYEQYRDKGITFAGVSLDRDPRKVVPPFVERYEMTYPILIPTADSALANAIETIPTTFLLDRELRVARVWPGALHRSELTKNIEELLSESPR